MNTYFINWMRLAGVTAAIVLISVIANAQNPRPTVPTTVPRSFTPSSTVRNNTPAAGAAAANNAADADDEDEDDEEDDGPATTTPALKFDNADGQFLLDAYAKETGQTLLIAPDIPKVQGITLRSQKGLPLTRDEYLEAIEITLGMNGIVLEPYGDKFLKVLPRKTIRVEGIKINMEKPEGGYPEKNKVISQMIQLKAITIDEAQKALEGFKRPDGLIQAFERTNSLLVTDTQENINRMLEVVKFIDQPLVATEEVNVRVIKFAKAEEIKKRLEEIVAESQKQNSGSRENIQMNRSGAPGISRQTQNFQFNNPAMRPGLTRLGQPQTTPQASANENISTLVSDADRGMIRGKVQVISDERSNQLIIITQKENMDFFDKIITVLDIETDPDVEVKVRRLDYAIAKDVTDMLNELIGNSSSRNDQNNTANNTQGSAGANNGRSQSLSDLARARAGINNNNPAANNNVNNNSAKAKLGQLSKDNIKIIQDERNNAIVMMGSPADLKALGEVIDNLDIPRLQVLIETVVLQVELGDDIKTGIDWVQRGKHKVKEAYTYTTADGETATGYRWVTTRDTIFNNGDQLGGGGGTGSSLLGGLLNLGTTVATNATEEVGNLLGARTGISYFLKSDKLNIAALIEASKSDSRTKVLSSPVLMTMDNQEATIEATSMRYLYKGVRYSGSSYNGSEVPDYEQRDIGLRVTITPRINPSGAVVLTIDESFETIGANQTVGTESYPTVNKRSLKAEVSVENMQTVVLGGLVQNELKKEETGIPILKDIPLIGKYLFGTTSSSDSRSELLVFLTPYVFNDAKDLTAEAMRRKAALSDDRPWIDYGWSRSKLADPVSHDEKMRRLKQRWANEDSEHNAELLYQKALKAREEQLAKRDAEEREKGIALPPKDDPEKTDDPDLPQQAVGDVGILTTTDTTEVLKLNGGDNRPQPPPDAETAAPAKKKSWWKFW